MGNLRAVALKVREGFSRSFYAMRLTITHRHQRAQVSVLENLPPEMARRRVLNTRDAAAFLAIPLPTFRRMRDRLPPHIPLSTRRHGWRIGDLIDWQDCRQSGREWRECQGAKAT
jgi:predicted DNA-binding transcriptional regulator AlpA